MNIGLFIYDTNYDPWPLNYEWKLIGLMLLKNSMLKTHALWCLQAFFYDMLWLWHLTSCSYNEKKNKKKTLYKLWLRLASKPMLYLFLWYHSAAFNFHLWPLKSTGFVHSLAPINVLRLIEIGCKKRTLSCLQVFYDKLRSRPLTLKIDRVHAFIITNH